MTQREKTFWWILSCEVTETNTKRRPTGDMFSLPPSWCCCVCLFSLCRCIRHKKCLHHFLVSFQSVRAVCSFCSETQLFQLFSKHKTWGKWWSRSFEWWWWVKGFIDNKEQMDLNLKKLIWGYFGESNENERWFLVTHCNFNTVCVTVAQTSSAVWRSGAGKRSFVQLWI